MNKKQRKNAERIATLADHFGSLTYNNSGQTVAGTLDLSIPCAYLIRAGVVTGVADTNDGVNDNAVIEVEVLSLRAVERAEQNHGRGWWSERADELLRGRSAR